MRLIIIECKRYLADYRKIFFSIIFTCIIGVSVYYIARELSMRGSIFEPFAIGVVNHDNATETEMFIRYFNNNTDFSKTIRLLQTDEEQAAKMLAEGIIPAYVIIPAYFVRDIITGKNSPFLFYGNRSMPLQAALSKLLAEAGIAFLSSSQSGIYATIDYAYENGLDSSIVEESIVLPINMQFAAKLLSFRDYFTEKVVTLNGSLSAGRYYLYSFTGLLLILHMMLWIPNLQNGFTSGLIIRYTAAGVSLPLVYLIRFSGIFAINLLLWSPMLLLIGLRVVFAALYTGALALLIADIFSTQQAAGLFLFFYGLLCLMASGGAVPMAYLPTVFHRLQYFTPNYWIIRLGTGLMPGVVLGGMATVFFAAALIHGLYRSAGREA